MSDVYCHSGNDRGGTVCRRGPITRARICGWAKGNLSTKTQDVIPANDAYRTTKESQTTESEKKFARTYLVDNGL